MAPHACSRSPHKLPAARRPSIDILFPSRELFRSAIAKTRTLFTQDPPKATTLSISAYVGNGGTLSVNVSNLPPASSRINATPFRNDYAPLRLTTLLSTFYDQAMDPFAADSTAPSVYFTYDDDLPGESTENSYERLIFAYYDEIARVDFTGRSASSSPLRDTTAHHDSIGNAAWEEDICRHSDSEDSDLFNFSPCASPSKPNMSARLPPKGPRSTYGALFGIQDSAEGAQGSPRGQCQNESYSSLCYLAGPSQPMDLSLLASCSSSPTPSLETLFNSSKDSSFDSPCSSLGLPSPVTPRITLPSIDEIGSDWAFFSPQKEPLDDEYDWKHKSLVHVDGELFEMVAPVEYSDAWWLGIDT
ncbi:hypothetical protein BOTBODRAFT_182988 [Botryobasidium botryosum FD-172 SS1]|uniref:Uncharacterized protein n=1 Tax=Botryobasidium botryosum (strain FD-172 SS1) TaxID=930990 RepID=A0A067NC75_BOTB1|nr:hypothetical protein BOTBODRAFT_182988 [Botryobasidium botryosum FD-172 SS1]